MKNSVAAEGILKLLTFIWFGKEKYFSDELKLTFIRFGDKKYLSDEVFLH